VFKVFYYFCGPHLAGLKSIRIHRFTLSVGQNKNKMEKFEKIKEVIAAVEADVTKFYDGGNAAAGTRVRKAMQDLKTLAQEVRTEVTEKKNSEK
jgi:hypothetical protein